MYSLKDLPDNPHHHTSAQLFPKPLKAFPSPQDRSPNDPVYVLSSGAVLRLVAQFRPEVTSKDNLSLRDFKDIYNYARGLGWEDVLVAGKQLILVVAHEEGEKLL